MPWDPATQAAIDRALAALARPVAVRPQQGPTAFQETAAQRAMRLYGQTVPQGEPWGRRSSNPYFDPVTPLPGRRDEGFLMGQSSMLQPTPLEKLGNARALAERVNQRTPSGATKVTPKRKKGTT